MIFFCESVATRLGGTLAEGPWQAMYTNTTTTQNGCGGQTDRTTVRVRYREIKQDFPRGAITHGPVETITITPTRWDGHAIVGVDSEGRKVSVQLGGDKRVRRRPEGRKTGALSEQLGKQTDVEVLE